MGCIIASYCCSTHVLFQSVANMAARRSGSFLLQRCIFCSRETLKRRRDFDVRQFSRIGNALFVASSRGGIFFASGKKQLIPLVHNRVIFLMLSLTNFKFLTFEFPAPTRKINPSFAGAISCHRREFHTSGK